MNSLGAKGILFLNRSFYVNSLVAELAASKWPPVPAIPLSPASLALGVFALIAILG
jgi:hypothetical protein